MYQKSELLNILKIKYKLEEGMKLTKKDIEQISKKEDILIKDLLCMFQINARKWRYLKKGKQKYTRMFFSRYQEIKDEKILEQESINLETFNLIKDRWNPKKYSLCNVLGISSYSYTKMKSSDKIKVRIKNMKIKHIVDLIKIDLRYLKKYGTRYYVPAELKKICKKREITLDDFLKYFNRSTHYRFNKMIVKKNKSGFWIGDVEIPEDFINENYERIIKKLYNVSNRLNVYLSCNQDREDLVQDAMADLWKKCGSIIKNFYFDIELMLNILGKRAKYFMINAYKKKYKNNNIHLYNHALY